MQDLNAKFAVGSRGDVKVTRDKRIPAESRHKATIAARVFRCAGTRFLNPATGMVEIALGDEVAEGKIGHWYDHGVISQAVVTSPIKAVFLIRWRMGLEKILKRIKEALSGYQF